MPPVLPSGLDAFVDHVVPILRARGLFRNEYARARPCASTTASRAPPTSTSPPARTRPSLSPTTRKEPHDRHSRSARSPRRIGAQISGVDIAGRSTRRPSPPSATPSTTQGAGLRRRAPRRRGPAGLRPPLRRPDHRPPDGARRRRRPERAARRQRARPGRQQLAHRRHLRPQPAAGQHPAQHHGPAVRRRDADRQLRRRLPRPARAAAAARRHPVGRAHQRLRLRGARGGVDEATGRPARPVHLHQVPHRPPGGPRPPADRRARAVHRRLRAADRRPVA